MRVIPRSGSPFAQESMFATTAAASSGVPSENVTPSLRWSVNSVALSFSSQLSAIQGLTCPSGST